MSAREQAGASDLEAQWPGVRLIAGIAALAAAVAVLIWLRFLTNGIWSDDWELYAQALRGTPLLEPTFGHFRPFTRLLFTLFTFWPNPAMFHLSSLVLHLLTAFAAWRYLRGVESPQVARIAALLFAGSFLGNEAIYWISGLGPILCLLSVLLAALAWRNGKPVVATCCLLAAALSYELWLVGLVMLLFEGRRRWTRWIGPTLVLCAFIAVQLFQIGPSSVTAYGGLTGGYYVQRLAVYAIRAVSPLTSFPGVPVSALVVIGMAALGLLRRYRRPVVFYFAAVLVLSLNASVFSFLLRSAIDAGMDRCPSALRHALGPRRSGNSCRVVLRHRIRGELPRRGGLPTGCSVL